MTAKPIWNYIPPALIALNTLLLAGNWYLRPQSAGSWFVVLLLLIGMTLALVLLSREPKEQAARRATMAIGGAFLAVRGNAIPKTLTPLAALHCDPAKAQAVQRLAGWIWALAGLAVAIAWLMLPINLAEEMSYLLLPSAILVTVGQAVWLRRTKPSAL
jgi:hypothetical protein